MSFFILSNQLLNAFLKQLPADLKKKFDDLKDAELSTIDFSFYTSVASVFSSKIEGEDIDLDSYVKHKREHFNFKPDYTKKTDDLYMAYTFAQNHELNEKNAKKVHQIISQNLISKTWQGKYRIQNMYVTTEDGKIDYVATRPDEVQTEMSKFWQDLYLLKKINLSFEEVFYFAAMLHLVFVKIHPWLDGNGRFARLLEKWFIAEKLGKKSWFLTNEKYYYQNHNDYYQNIRQLGIEYEALNYANALPFLLMLPKSL
jgi:Fic family protein